MSTLANILRPTSLNDYIGQTHLVGNHKPIQLLLKNNHLFSIIFWGPPGIGKTSLARIIASHFNTQFYNLSAVSTKKDDIRKIIQTAEKQTVLLETYQPPIIFLDEIHRFNKAQQDFLLPFVETNKIILIGATTQNPSFEVIPALLSRIKIFTLKSLTDTEIIQVINKATTKLQFKKTLTQNTIKWLVNYANGDARKLLNIIENTYQLYHQINPTALKDTLQSNTLNYDKKGAQHYDTISAFIKSMRASNINASLYYLARMVASGEDPKFIARRMIIFASEDIGLAVPTALVVANEVFQAVTRIGYPEAQINLAHGVAYLCRCKKDRSTYNAYFKALNDVQKYGNLPIPLKLRNATDKITKKLGYAKNYTQYPNNQESLLPTKLVKRKYFK